MKKNDKFIIIKEYGDKKLNDIILEWAVQEVNKEKGYEFAKIKED
jgi:hypothetical protein